MLYQLSYMAAASTYEVLIFYLPVELSLNKDFIILFRKRRQAKEICSLKYSIVYMVNEKQMLIRLFKL